MTELMPKAIVAGQSCLAYVKYTCDPCFGVMWKVYPPDSYVTQVRILVSKLEVSTDCLQLGLYLAFVLLNNLDDSTLNSSAAASGTWSSSWARKEP